VAGAAGAAGVLAAELRAEPAFLDLHLQLAPVRIVPAGYTRCSRRRGVSSRRRPHVAGDFSAAATAALVAAGATACAASRSLGAMDRDRSSQGADVERGGPPEEVEVVSYNLLSSHLSQPSYFWHNDPADLRPETRLKRVLKKLRPTLSSGAVICLQECSMLWSGKLHTFFQRHGYHFVFSNYGLEFNGHMGVAIAFPTWRYEAADVLLQRVAESKRWPDTKRPMLPAGRKANALDLASYFASPFLFEGNDDEDVVFDLNEWEYSRTRQNTMVAVMLKPKQGDVEPFAVATYHMPCAYWAPKVMVIHTALAAQCAHRFARGRPLVLAGDWNFKPGAAPYQLLTTGKLSADHPAHPGSMEGDEWDLQEGLPGLQSAYAVKNPGGEPEFTNYAWVRDDSDPFIGTLDYIFVSRGADVLSVGKLPTISSCPSPLPTRDEPSDHLMLSARLRPYGGGGDGNRRPKAAASTPWQEGSERPGRKLMTRDRAFGGSFTGGFGGGSRGRGFGVPSSALGESRALGSFRTRRCQDALNGRARPI